MQENLELVKKLIKNDIPDAIVEVTDLTGTYDHLGVTVVSEVFRGKMTFEQHQIIMTILKDALKSQIHAVKIKTMTPEKYNN